MSINESDLIARLHAVAEGFEMPPTPPAEDAWRGRRRVRRNRVVVAGAAAAAVAVVLGITAAVGGQDRVEPAPIEQPQQDEQPDQPDSTGIFAGFHGWIVYGRDDGIWAVNPSLPADQEPKLVTDRPGKPIGWSNDGTKLLVARELSEGNAFEADYSLLVMDADGTETRVAAGTGHLDGSISPDGTQVIYSDAFSGNVGIYTVGIDGGTPTLLHAPEPEADPEPGDGPVTMFDRETYFPVFSPDGTQVAFFDGHGDWGHRLRVMNADGTGSRTLDEKEGHIHGLTWSPDGQFLMFATDEGFWVINVDGSGLSRVPGGSGGYPPPVWSPDGSQISYTSNAGLYIADPDGSQATIFSRARVSQTYGRSVHWNPLPLEGGAE